jgi:hypothetical protein
MSPSNDKNVKKSKTKKSKQKKVPSKATKEIQRLIATVGCDMEKAIHYLGKGLVLVSLAGSVLQESSHIQTIISHALDCR